jgi:hypothetical protein
MRTGLLLVVWSAFVSLISGLTVFCDWKALGNELRRLRNYLRCLWHGRATS